MYIHIRRSSSGIGTKSGKGVDIVAFIYTSLIYIHVYTHICVYIFIGQAAGSVPRAGREWISWSSKMAAPAATPAMSFLPVSIRCVRERQNARETEREREREG